MTMKSYTAYCTNEDGENLCMTREYTAKAHFISDLHGNGYKVHFVALTDKYDEESAKYYERLETKRRRAAIHRQCEREWKRRDAEIEKAVAEAVAEETNEEPAQEVETMRFRKEWFCVQTKKIEKDNMPNITRFDADVEFDVSNCTEAQEPDAIRKAVEKFVDELKKHGGAEILVESLEMSLRFDEFGPECTFNEIRNGGNAYEIEINRYDDKSMSIYLRICEHQDAPTEEEPAEVQEPEENEKYIAWCGMIENDVITEEYETLSEAIDEVETKYSKEEQKALGVTYCRLLCTAGQWLECLDEKTVDDVYYF